MGKVRFIALMALRERREDECRRTVGRLERQRAELIEARDALEAERLAAAVHFHDPALHEVYACYWRRIDGELQGFAQRIAATEQDIAKARTELIEAHREVTVIAKLQERDRRELARAAERRERKQLDEFAGSRRALLNAATSAEASTP